MMTLIINIGVTAIKLHVFMLLLLQKKIQSILSIGYFIGLIHRKM